jgi:glycosyltransferase involved in cell wall biosynthesis
MIPEIVENGVNGFISNDEEELKQYLVDLLNDEELAKKLGENARKTIVENFSQEEFIRKWDFLLKQTAKKFFRG